MSIILSGYSKKMVNEKIKTSDVKVENTVKQTSSETKSLLKKPQAPQTKAKSLNYGIKKKGLFGFGKF